jgi:putative oxidoreductase
MTTMDAGLLVLRLGMGLIFAVHGAQKMFGWWGGQGLRGWQGTMERMGYRPTLLFAVASALGEFAGGLMLAIGVLTPLAALVVTAQVVVIIVGVHRPRGFFNKDNGYEFPLALAAGFLAIELAGPGRLSIDAALGLGLPGNLRLALAALGIAAGFLVLAVPRISRGRPPKAG